VEGIITVPIYNVGDKTGYSNYRVILLLSTKYKMLFNIFSVDFDATDQLLNLYCAFVKFLS